METASVTRLLAAHRAGDDSALDRAFVIVYDDLRRIARHQRRGDPRDTLSTTALVHELYLKFSGSDRVVASDRPHLLALASRAMRQIVIDYARQRQARKRGGGEVPMTLDHRDGGVKRQSEDLISVDEALHKLETLDERLVRLVECRFFAGLSEQDTADTLKLSVSTVQRDWKRAKAWLREHMTE